MYVEIILMSKVFVKTLRRHCKIYLEIIDNEVNHEKMIYNKSNIADIN